MAKRRNTLQIEVSLKGVRNVLSKLGQIRKAAGQFGSNLTAAAGAAGAAFMALIQTIFFVREAIRTLVSVAKGVFDFFLKDAITAERLEVALKHVTGSAESAAEIMARVDEASQNLGLDWGTAAQAGQQLAIAAKDAQGNFDINLWQELFQTVMAFSSLRPDVPLSLMARGVTAAMMGDMTTLTRLLDVNVNQLLGLSEEADEVLKKGGQLQGLVEMRADEVADSARGGIDALRTLREQLGATDEMMEEVAQTTAGTMGQAREEFKSLVRDFAEELLPGINEGLKELLGYWRDNEDEIRAFANTLGRDLGGALRDVPWEDVGPSLVSILKALTDFALVVGGAKEFKPFPKAAGGFYDWAERVTQLRLEREFAAGLTPEERAAYLSEDFGGGNIWEKIGLNINIFGDAGFVQDVVVEAIPGAAGGATPPSDTTRQRFRTKSTGGKKPGGTKASTRGRSAMTGGSTSSLGGG